MRVCRKMITAAAVVCVVAACSMFPAFAHGHCRDGASYRYPVCTEEGCQETGRHIHDGKTYCGYDHERGYCDGSCPYYESGAQGGSHHHRGGCHRG